MVVLVVVELLRAGWQDFSSSWLLQPQIHCHPSASTLSKNFQLPTPFFQQSDSASPIEWARAIAKCSEVIFRNCDRACLWAVRDDDVGRPACAGSCCKRDWTIVRTYQTECANAESQDLSKNTATIRNDCDRNDRRRGGGKGKTGGRRRRGVVKSRKRLRTEFSWA